jgi:hypothetical protein
MKIKTVISLLTFALTFGFSAYFASFFIPEKIVVKDVFYNYDYNPVQNDSAILKFLRQDIQNGEERSYNCYNRRDESNTKSELKNYVLRKAASVKIYSEASSSMDSTSFPRDFRVAWKKHMKAWRDYSNFLEKSSKETNINEDEFFAKTEEMNDEISATWQDVLDIGENYDERVAFEIY